MGYAVVDEPRILMFFKHGNVKINIEASNGNKDNKNSNYIKT